MKGERGPTNEEWRTLYEVLEQTRQLAPWRWLDQTHIFGVEDPESGEVGYVSVQGAYDEDPGVTLYRGEEGWEAHWALIEFAAETGVVPDELALSIPMLVAGWTSAEQLAPHEVERLRGLGLAPQDDTHWPIARSFRPGWAPWYLTGHETRFLTLALEQLLILAERVRPQGGAFLIDRLAQGQVLVRTRRQPPDRWTDEWRPLPEIQNSPYRVHIPGPALDELRQIPPNKDEVQVDFFMLPSAIAESPHERPYIPYILLLVDADANAVIQAEVLDAREGVRTLYEQLPGRVVDILREQHVRPAHIGVRSERLKALLEGVAQELAVGLEKRQALRPLDLIRIALLEKVVRAGVVDEAWTQTRDGSTA